MGQTLAIANQKGGVGKTTTTINLAASLAALQLRTLVVDLDPQGNASSGLGVVRGDIRHSVYEVLAGTIDAREALLVTDFENLHLLPSKTELAAAELELVTVEERREYFLKDALESLRDDFDYILIDCPPSLSLLTINALVAADAVLIPVQAEYYALEGLARLRDTIARVKQHLNPALAIDGLVLTMHDNRNNLARQVEDDVRAHFGDNVYTTVIPRNVRLSEAPSFGQPIITYDVTSRGARAYLDLAREFVERKGDVAR